MPTTPALHTSKYAGWIARLRRFPLGHALAQCGVADLDFQNALIDVDVNGVAFVYGGDRSAQRGFGRDVAHHQAASGAAEAAVGQQRYRSAQAFADNRRSHAQHLAHAGTALGPFVADDHHVAGLDALSGDRGHGIFFGFENARRAAMAQAFVPADLGDAAFGREIAAQNHQAASLLQRLVQRRNHFLAGRFDAPSRLRLARVWPVTVIAILVECLPSSRRFTSRRDAAGAVHVSGHKAAGRLQIGQQRRAFADFLEIVDVQRNASFARNRQQVQYRVGRAAGGSHAGDRVFERMARQDVFADDALASADSSPLRRSRTRSGLFADPWRERC